MRRARRSTAVVILLLLALPRWASASFHITSISELGAGFQDDPDIQFVEIRLDSPGQTQLVNTRLTAFDADGHATELVLADHVVTNGATGRNVLFATAAFASATGVTPDFVIPPGIPTPTGMICWGAPGASAPDPSTWDFDKPNNYVDCVAYGAYGAPTRSASGIPSSLAPGDGEQSLTRTKGTGTSGSNDTDFALATPNVCNNANACTDLATGAEQCGDANGDGSTTVTDGVQTLRAAAGLSSPCTLARCDVNGSGDVTVTDGVQVLRAAAGLPIAGDCTAAN